MAKGKKLDLDIGAFNQTSSDWQVVQEQLKQSVQTKLPHEHQLHCQIEKRKGKVVTLISPFFLSQKAFKTLLKELKSSLACGGSLQEQALLLQGDVIKEAKALLEAKSYRFKR